jgi:hypothetical protein
MTAAEGSLVLALDFFAVRCPLMCMGVDWLSAAPL